MKSEGRVGKLCLHILGTGCQRVAADAFEPGQKFTQRNFETFAYAKASINCICSELKKAESKMHCDVF